MRRLVIILMLFLPLLISGQSVYYVAPTGGSDSNSGSITEPWATWQKAFTTADAGDTVYFRGGVWYPTAQVNHDPDAVEIWNGGLGVGNKGTYANKIHFFNYPGETPILDCQNFNSQAWDIYGLNLVTSDYIKLRGLTVRNVRQRYVTNPDPEVYTYGYPNFVRGIRAGGTWVHLENVTVHNIGGYGFTSSPSDTIYWINCDAYNCLDSLTIGAVPPHAPQPGNKAKGFAGGQGGTAADTAKIQYFIGSRAWNCSDDGFDFGSGKQLYIENCWTWNNNQANMTHGLGNGFRFNNANVYRKGSRVIKNSISAFTKGYALTNTNMLTPYNMEAYNMFLYEAPLATLNAFGQTCEDLLSIYGFSGRLDYVNIIAYENGGYVGAYTPCNMVHLTNSWTHPSTPNYTITDDDFITAFDSTTIVNQLSAARKADGSLPNITVFRLASDSPMKGAGTDVGMSATPDIGIDWAYYDLNFGGAIVEVTSIDVYGTGNATTITTNDGTLQMVADILPIDATYQTVTWSRTNGTGTASISSSGLLTALTNGTVTVRATAVDGSGVYGEQVITISNQTEPTITSRFIQIGGKFVKSIRGNFIIK